MEGFPCENFTLARYDNVYSTLESAKKAMVEGWEVYTKQVELMKAPSKNTILDSFEAILETTLKSLKEKKQV